MIRSRAAAAVMFTLMIAISMVFLGPMLFMVFSSFKPDAQIFLDLRSLNALLPTGHISLENYRKVFDLSPLPRYFLNSLVVSGVTVALGILVNSMAAFGLQRLHWPGRQWVLTAILALLVIPFEVVAIPLMLMVSRLPWLASDDGRLVLVHTWFNSLHVQIFPFIANAFCIFLFYQSFRDIPRELDEAARIDGAGWFRIYWSIILPNAKPVIATAAIVLFLAMWNQYLWPILVIQEQQARPVMVGIRQFFGQNMSWGQVMAYATLITVPVICIYVAFQRYFVESVVQSGIK